MFGGAMAPLMLLGSKQVQEELKLTDEQKDSIKTLAREMRPARGEGRPSPEEMQKRAEKIDKKLADILKPEQIKRYKEIRIQVQGPDAFLSPEVVKALAITDEQQKKVKDIIGESRKEMRSLGRPDEDSTPAERKEFREKIQKIRKEAAGKCLESLTSDQREKFESLRGKPFDLDWSALGQRSPRRNPQPRERSDW
jgi:Spy/CpxP family protein refolding chaperone